jgi:putative phosphoribosyl transferase
MTGREKMNTRYRDRVDAGRQLARHLAAYRNAEDTIVLGLPRGGVPVASEVAHAINVPLDILLVRKLGHPRQPELAIGAIASGGVRVLNERLSSVIDEATISAVETVELRELQRRETAYRGDRPLPRLTGKRVIVVDDGLATGSTMQAAIMAIRQQRPSSVIVAVPVAPPETVAELERFADEVICPLTPDFFMAIGQFYDSFTQTSDDQVRDLLEQASRRFPEDHSAGSNATGDSYADEEEQHYEHQD